MSLFKKPVDRIKDQLTEKRPLPTGVAEFHEWADRIISGSGLTADSNSQKFALANDLMHCPPNMAFETDVYFIHRLRKYAVNQVADHMRNVLREEAKTRLAAEEAKLNQATAMPPETADGKVLEQPKV